jgi:hypothetical protein
MPESAGTRRDRIDRLLTQLVEQLERKMASGDGLTEADSRVLLQLHKQAVGYEETPESSNWTVEDTALLHELARKDAPEDS